MVRHKIIIIIIILIAETYKRTRKYLPCEDWLRLRLSGLSFMPNLTGVVVKVVRIAPKKVIDDPQYSLIQTRFIKNHCICSYEIQPVIHFAICVCIVAY